MDHQPQRLKQALENLRHALEETESALFDLDDAFAEEGERARPQKPRAQDLLSVAEICQELGMGKSWVHHRLRRGEIPNIRLGNNIKVRRKDLEGYLESQRYQAPNQQQEE